MMVAFGIDSNCVAFTVFFSILLAGAEITTIICVFCFARTRIWGIPPPFIEPFLCDGVDFARRRHVYAFQQARVL